MNFDELLKRRGIDPEKVLVMRHVEKSPKTFRETLERWARDEPDLFNSYQRGQGSTSRISLAKATYLASFIGHEPGKAKFVGLYRHSRKPRKVSHAQYLRIPKNRELARHGLVFHYHPDHLWFYLDSIRRFEDLKLKLVIDWPGRPNAWYRWADPDRNEFRILQGTNLTHDGRAFQKGEQAIEAQVADSSIHHQLDYKYRSKAQIRKAAKDEERLMIDFRTWLENQGRELKVAKYDGLRCDGYERQKRILVEAKSSTSREHIRMAVGQLLDYGFQIRKTLGRSRMAILLPRKPDPDSVNWLSQLRISVIWRESGVFVDNADSKFCGK